MSYHAIPDRIPSVDLTVQIPAQKEVNKNELDRSRISNRFVVLFTTLLATLAFSIMFVKSTEPTYFEAAAHEAEDVRACSFDECERSGCNAETAPFMCVAARVHWFYHITRGGCSATPWMLTGCEDQCDIRSCQGQKPVPSEPSCKGLECPNDFCFPALDSQRCSKSHPFQVRAWYV